MSKELLAELNLAREIDGKAPFADWRKARHMPMLEEYRKNIAGAVALLKGDTFEASQEELAAQVGRESADVARDEAMLADLPGVVLPASDDKKALNKIAKSARKAVAKTEKVLKQIEKDFAAPSYKEMVRHEKSTVEKPFNVVHSFLDANPTLKRKDAIAKLVEMGINFYTARTQYQKWFTNQKEA